MRAETKQGNTMDGDKEQVQNNKPQEAAMARQCTEHFYASVNVPNCPLWVRHCMLCGDYDGADMNQQLEVLTDRARIDELDNITGWSVRGVFTKAGLDYQTEAPISTTDRIAALQAKEITHDQS
jgi:hypothetical protein